MSREWEREDEGRWNSGNVVPEGGPFASSLRNPWRGCLRLWGRRILTGGSGWVPPTQEPVLRWRWSRGEWETGVRHDPLGF